MIPYDDEGVISMPSPQCDDIKFRPFEAFRKAMGPPIGEPISVLLTC